MDQVVDGILTISILVLIYSALMKRKASRIRKAEHIQTGTLGQKEDGTAVSIEGRSVGEELLSPVTHTPCLYYELNVEGSWDNDDSDDDDSTKSETYLDKKEGRIGIDDGSGVAHLDIDKAEELELRETFRETKKEGRYDDLVNTLGMNRPIVFRNFNFTNPPGSEADRFTCTEKVFEETDTVFAAGYTKEGVLSDKGMSSLIVSKKGREALLEEAMSDSKKAFYGGLAGLLAGIALSIAFRAM